MAMSDTEQLLQNIAQDLDKTLNGTRRPKRAAFVVLVVPFDGPEGARTNYVSNADRKDVVAMLKEVVARFEGQPYQEGTA